MKFCGFFVVVISPSSASAGIVAPQKHLEHHRGTLDSARAGFNLTSSDSQGVCPPAVVPRSSRRAPPPNSAVLSTSPSPPLPDVGRAGLAVYWPPAWGIAEEGQRPDVCLHIRPIFLSSKAACGGCVEETGEGDFPVCFCLPRLLLLLLWDHACPGGSPQAGVDPRARTAGAGGGMVEYGR